MLPLIGYLVVGQRELSGNWRWSDPYAQAVYWHACLLNAAGLSPIPPVEWCGGADYSKKYPISGAPATTRHLTAATNVHQKRATPQLGLRANEIYIVAAFRRARRSTHTCDFPIFPRNARYGRWNQAARPAQVRGPSKF